MKEKSAIAVVGAFDSKGEERLFLKKCIEININSSLSKILFTILLAAT
jgi:hypothetical protein